MVLKRKLTVHHSQKLEHELLQEKPLKQGALILLKEPLRVLKSVVISRDGSTET